MLVCFISDIHGNEIAFDQCLKRIKFFAPDMVFFLGDAVGYFPSGKEILEKLNMHNISCQVGNHEQMLIDGLPSEKDNIYNLILLRNKIKPDALQRVMGWPTRREIIIEGRSLLLVHGSPDNELEEYIYPDNNLDSLVNKSYDLIFMGHTHYPFIKNDRGKTIVNVGSVGLPRDNGQLASMVLYDSRTSNCRVLRFEIDIDKIIGHYGTLIHESVTSCLLRKSNSFFGELIK